MTASAANGFRQVLFEPNSQTCHESPYAFHPMFSTSSESTHLAWTAHTFNIGAAAEIGHYEAPDEDDDDGQFAQDGDFDGTSYLPDWPGTLSAPQDALLHPSPFEFRGPRFVEAARSVTTIYSRVAFETTLPLVETNPDSPQQCDIVHGTNCVIPPKNGQGGQTFYPIFSTALSESGFACVWHLGGNQIPNTTDVFGGDATTEFGSLIKRSTTGHYNDFRRILADNPCPNSIAYRIHNPILSTELQAITNAILGELIAVRRSLLDLGVPRTSVDAVTQLSISFMNTLLQNQQSQTTPLLPN